MSRMHNIHGVLRVVSVGSAMSPKRTGGTCFQKEPMTIYPLGGALHQPGATGILLRCPADEFAPGEVAKAFGNR